MPSRPRAARASRLPSRFPVFVLVAVLIAGCGSVPVQETDAARAAPVTHGVGDGDPLEGFNRAMYAFNDGLDRSFSAGRQGLSCRGAEVRALGVSNFFRTSTIR